jgi:hypothetical protein
MANFDVEHEQALEQLTPMLLAGVRPVIDRAKRLGTGMVTLNVREAPGGIEVTVQRGPFRETSPVLKVELPEPWDPIADAEYLTERVARSLSETYPDLGFLTTRHNYLPVLDELVKKGVQALDGGANSVRFLLQEGEQRLGRPLTAKEIAELRFRLLRLRRNRRNAVDL